MIHVEFHENKPFRHPEDYDVFDPREERARRSRMVRSSSVKPEKQQRNEFEKSKQEEQQMWIKQMKEELKLKM